MIPFHHISQDQCVDLVRLCGGVGPATRLLGVTRKQLEAWQRTSTTPQAALRLLWLLSPDGNWVLHHDLSEKLRLLSQVRAALERELWRVETDLARVRTAYQAEVDQLKLENQRLRSLISHPGLTSVLGTLSADLQTITDTLLDKGGDTTKQATAAPSSRVSAA